MIIIRDISKNSHLDMLEYGSFYTLHSHYVVHPDDEEYIEWEKSDLARELGKEMTPGVFLRLLREAHDLSQAALGEKIDVSAKRVSDYENGQRGISKEIAKQLAHIFNVSPARFI